MRLILLMCTMVWLSLVILLACSDKGPLSPFQCRVTGVAVEDGDTVTGVIIEEIYYQTPSQAQAACFKPFNEDNLGCVVALGEGEYRVVYTNSGFIRQTPYVNAMNHERCHAYYEEWSHM